MTQPPGPQPPPPPAHPPAGSPWPAPPGAPGPQPAPGYGQPYGAYPPYPAAGGYPPYPPYPPYPAAPGYQPPVRDPALAEWWERLVARLIDGLIIGIPGVALWIAVYVSAISQLAQVSPGNTGGGSGQISASPPPGFFLSFALIILVSVGLVLLYFGYDWLQHALWGQTIGKRIMGTMVVTADTRARISGGAACGRAAVYTLPGLLSSIGGLFILIDVLWLTWDPRRQCLHDKVARTVVVRKKMLAVQLPPGQPGISG